MDPPNVRATTVRGKVESDSPPKRGSPAKGETVKPDSVPRKGALNGRWWLSAEPSPYRTPAGGEPQTFYLVTETLVSVPNRLLGSIPTAFCRIPHARKFPRWTNPLRQGKNSVKSPAARQFRGIWRGEAEAVTGPELFPRWASSAEWSGPREAPF